ncbi:ParB/RepB/Spo0J family partition protein [Candidatus Saccharibacteria bacterium]|nr:ParB/RepB/Spo0J family partition protein [Candidatus Saccharibacteria bacterium]
MVKPKKGLGRGFSSLIPDELLDESFDPTASQDQKVSDLRQIKTSQISPDPEQPRRNFDEVALDQLTASIREHGVLQPIVVIAKGDGYIIVAGERRWRAATRAGLDKIPALVRTLSAQHKLEISLIENLQRKDLNPLETATAYLKLRDQFNLSLDEIATRMGAGAVSTISNKLRLLKLSKYVQDALVNGALTEGQARPLIGVDEAVVADVLPLIVKEQWSARRIEQFIVDLKKGDVKPQKAVQQPVVTPAVTHLTKRFEAPVKVRTNSKGAGSITIGFKNAEDFERIEKLLGGK